MNHYLQRMALSAIKPGGTIHPILDSMYSPRRDRSDSRWIQENLSVGDSRTAQPSAGTMALAIARVPEISLSPKPVVEEVKPVMSKVPLTQPSVLSAQHTIENVTTTFAGLMAPAQREADRQMPFAANEEQGQLTRQQSPQEQSPPPISIRPNSPRKLAAISSRRELSEPRISSAPLTAGSPTHRLAPPNVRGLKKQQPNIEKFQRSAPTIQQPDEIQIHIGRIEVTAVHPAPAPAAANPKRNVPSLDEYLKRRDRRAS